MDELVAGAEAGQRRREAWVQRHPAEVRWEAALAERVTARHRALAAVVEHEPPEHVVRLLGPPPAVGTRRHEWLRLAERLEAHRERWRIPPERLGSRFGRSPPHAGEWLTLRRDIDRWAGQNRSIRRSSDRDRGLELGW